MQLVEGGYACIVIDSEVKLLKFLRIEERFFGSRWIQPFICSGSFVMIPVL